MPVNERIPDYDLDEMVVVTAPGQLRALADPLRRTLLDLLLERAATVTEMARAVGRPKSTIAYHVNLLVDAGLLRVVRTRRVRAIEERSYGRIARTLYIGMLSRPEDKQVVAAINGLAEAAAESAPATRPTSCGARSCTPASRSRRCGISGRRSRSSPAGSPRSPGPATRSMASPPASTPLTPPPFPTPRMTWQTDATGARTNACTRLWVVPVLCECYRKGVRSSPALARKPPSKPGLYCVRLSRVLTSAVSWARLCLVRLARERLRCDQTCSTGLSSFACGGSRNTISQSRAAIRSVIAAAIWVFRLSHTTTIGAASCWCSSSSSRA